MNFILYRNIANDKILNAFWNSYGGERSDAIYKMIEISHRFGLAGNVFKNYLAYLVAMAENPFSVANERNTVDKDCSLYKLFCSDVAELFTFAQKAPLATNFVAFGDSLVNFVPKKNVPFNFESKARMFANFAKEFGEAKSPLELEGAITRFYLTYGCGKFALANAFRYNINKRTLESAYPIQDVQLSDIIGYESQKLKIIKNTEDFIAGKASNNVLLYGAGGTGKSTTIKAILNRYAFDGLRIIEVYKQHFPYLDDILDEVKNRNYRFILFLDDLSFENFETEYKYLKAFIEGGITAKPENVLIYATSNRRHLMKETWNDRTDKEEDMHISETMQEKLSLVDRFGLAIRFVSPEQEEYLNIAHQTAIKLGAKPEDVETEEFEKEAVQWELRHGGFSGRCAAQFATSFVNKEK